MLNQAQEPDLSVATEPNQTMNILVLDDNEVDRRRLLRLCENAGLNFVATEAASISEMRSALKSKQFDLVFIDYLLVDEDGLDAVRLLVDDPAQTAVSIMIAGEGRMDVAIEAMRLGCSDYLTKSDISVDALRKSVATALERHLMITSLNQERDRRQKLERAIHRYASACSIEMRTILAGTLRRLRKLRAYASTEDHALQLGDLENSIDKLWEALPEFNENTLLEIEGGEQAAPPMLIRKH